MCQLLFKLILIIGCVVPVSLSWGYEEVTVDNGGTLTGRIILVGDVPAPKGYNLVTFPDPFFCGRISDGKGWRLLQPFQVGAENGLKDVVVFIQNIKKGKPFEFATPRVEAVDCQFAPYITVVRDRDKVEVVNLDPVMHDIQAYETSHLGARVLFNVPLPMSHRLQKNDFMAGRLVKNRAGKVMTQHVKMRKGRNVFVMQCGFHAYMESWGLAVDNPYFAMSRHDGAYGITDIPAGIYRVIAWHPMLTQEVTVTIEAGETKTLNMKFDAPKGRLYANQAQENTRFGTELLGDAEIVPVVEQQTR